ncbi:nucleotidyltransferase domain-containing protein [Candidatus Peregrinibacteria bacterium]|nr:nucleotidyltransferase domain-containing protein [Candidatus Peregrinibacteria bacterium]MBI3816800.1 nucleotidyltransferase domain-containing protein [Candidatus Peregrinibacteria bacterium]
MNNRKGLSTALRFKNALLQQGYPVEQVLLFGSHAKGTQRQKSDIDVAVICKPFLPTRMDEMGKFWIVASDVDLRIEPICLHPEDFDEKYSTIIQEVKRTGIAV